MQNRQLPITKGRNSFPAKLIQLMALKLGDRGVTQKLFIYFSSPKNKGLKGDLAAVVYYSFFHHDSLDIHP